MIETVLVSSIVLGFLLAAFIISITQDLVRFFEVLTVIASFSVVLFIVMKNPVSAQKENTAPADKQSIKNTLRHYFSPRILPLQPLFVTSGFNLAMLTLFIPFELAKMDALSYSYSKQMRLGLLSLVCLGIGKLLGRVMLRSIYHDHPISLGALANFFVLFVTFAVLFTFHTYGEFDWHLASVMTFTWGFVDAGNASLICYVLNSQFEHEAVSVSCFKITQGLACAVFLITAGFILTYG